MRTALGRGIELGVAALLAAAPVQAQLFSNPVYFSPSHGTGFSLNGEYARGFYEDELDTDINFAGGRAVLGLGPVSIMGGAGAAFAQGESEVTFGGAVALNILDLPAVPVSLNVQGGVGVTDFDGFTWMDIPIGVGLAINVPAPLLDVEPWIAPRVHILRLSNDESQTETGYGISGGLNITLPTGLGFHVAGDYVKVSDFDFDNFVVGAGVHFRIAIPGLVPGGIVK
jgi:opacity protein-like surface antigen